MRLIITELRSHLLYKIIAPFLLLTLIVAFAGLALSFTLIAGSRQERFNNQLAQTARLSNDALVDQERANLQFLGEIATAQENAAAGAPAVADALERSDTIALYRAIDPYYVASTSRPGVNLDRLIVFDRSGQSLIDWIRPRDARNASIREAQPTTQLTHIAQVQQVLNSRAEQLSGYAGLLRFDDSYYFFTVVPVVPRGSTVPVGGIMLATDLNDILRNLARRSQASVIVAFDADRTLLASNDTSLEGLAALSIDQRVADQVLNVQLPAEQRAYFDTRSIDVGMRPYQFVYGPLQIRNQTLGILGVALSRDYVVDSWNDLRLPFVVLTILLMLMISALGYWIAQRITRPLQELVETADSVMGGDLGRRSRVAGFDEVGVLSRSFNSMTDHIVRLYSEVRAESSRRAAIVESIADGIVVCDNAGNIQLLNRAARELLGLHDSAPAPARFADLPLEPINDGNAAFGSYRSGTLYRLQQTVVRVSASSVVATDETLLGSVYVLQDMTAEFAVDRAKTNFITTISHEMRTPLTVLRGNADLLLRGLMGPLEPDQRDLIEAMRERTAVMTTMLTNVITIANIEAGTLRTEPESFDIRSTLEEALWPLRSQITAKGLLLKLDLPDELPLVLADRDQVRTICSQLLDNALRYTRNGSISVRIRTETDALHVAVCDTGCGIEPELQSQLFNRFVRGADGLTSPTRGLGLGLAIVKQFVERQGGSIAVSSKPGLGSEFTFTLPYAQTDGHTDDSSNSLRALAVAA